eukprot:Nk52_evm8s153 gene=Nk52_evmTU8s153
MLRAVSLCRGWLGRSTGLRLEGVGSGEGLSRARGEGVGLSQRVGRTVGAMLGMKRRGLCTSKEGREGEQEKGPVEITDNLATIPNFLSMTRIVATPGIAHFIVSQQHEYALGLFVYAAVTDALDGYIARNFKGQRSVFGTALDPFADKLLMTTLVGCLGYSGQIPAPLATLIIGRDVGLMAGGFYYRYKTLPPPKTISRFFDGRIASVEMHPTTLSKVNTVLQVAVVALALAGPVFGGDAMVDMGILTDSTATAASTSAPSQDHLSGSSSLSSLFPLAVQGLWWLTAATTFGSGVSYVVRKDTVRALYSPKK